MKKNILFTNKKALKYFSTINLLLLAGIKKTITNGININKK